MIRARIPYLGKIVMLIGLVSRLANFPTIVFNSSSPPYIVVDVDKNGKISRSEAAIANVQNYVAQQNNIANMIADRWNQFISRFGDGMAYIDYLDFHVIQARVYEMYREGIEQALIAQGVAYLALSADSINPLDKIRKKNLADSIAAYCLLRNLNTSAKASCNALDHSFNNYAGWW